jgi:redox-sensitive bicupin YhaK (pirin superfamily)
MRAIASRIRGRETSDGAGVKLFRVFSPSPRADLDPFLMLDEFFSDEPSDYLAGFPNHPHRGFETVTYMLDGHMLHEDHLGNRGDLKGGDVQWMTAGRGIIHSEMPQQTAGRMRGFQLWINLPAAEKMKPAGYRDIAATQIPELALAGGGKVKVIAGEVVLAQGTARGPMQGLTTDPLYADVHLAAGASVELPVMAGYTAFAYVYDGAMSVAGTDLPRGDAAILTDGTGVALRAGGEGGRCLVLAARPLREPVVPYGPFVMNTREEIEQALRDYRDGRLTA